MFSLIPKEYKFFDMFEQSMRNILRGGQLFLEAIKDGGDFAEKVKTLKDIEHIGDKITHETVEILNKTFITPIDREDIHLLISRMDDVIDLIETSADKLLIYKITKFSPELIKLAELLVESIERLVDAVSHMRNHKDYNRIFTHCIEINRLENEADVVNRRAIRDLFDHTTDPIEIIKWKDVYGDLEFATDKCEDIANVLEGVVLKNV